MAIIIDQDKRVLVQGITGREGRARTKLMREFGTNVVAGCPPGKDIDGSISYHKKIFCWKPHLLSCPEDRRRVWFCP